MASIFVAAVDSAQDRTDLERSVAMPIERQHVIRSFSDATYPELIDIERRGHGFYGWGLHGQPENIQHWFQMGVGDFVLLVQRDHFRYYAKVLGRYQNARAASLIWGADRPEQDLREYLFFLSEPVPLSLPCTGPVGLSAALARERSAAYQPRASTGSRLISAASSDLCGDGC